ncbi:MAG: ECF transporter S component [Clostridia bacterium]|nr:ECF transporter S component [Clostridia bacterium]
MTKSNEKVTRLVLLALFTAIMLIMSMTPLGYLNIGPLAITLNVIPLGIAAIALGPTGGLAMGAVFGLTSFLQCIGIGGVSAMGAVLFQINPVLAFIQRFVPRVLDGLLIGLLHKFMVSKCGEKISCFITGFLAAFLNTALFMGSLVLLFGQTEYMQELIDGRNVLVFICSFVGINAVFEILASTIITGSIGSVLYKSKVINKLR